MRGACRTKRRSPRLPSTVPSSRSVPAQGTGRTVWPCYSLDWAAWTLALYPGDIVLYVGEWRACTADDTFHDLLDEHFEEAACVDIPQWFGLHDRLYVYKRKAL